MYVLTLSNGVIILFSLIISHILAQFPDLLSASHLLIGYIFDKELFFASEHGDFSGGGGKGPLLFLVDAR
jgi:hypothetical protein